MTRVENWEAALHVHLEAARDKPYKLGRHDCALWAIRVVRDLTGVDYGAGVRGKYSGAKSAVALLRKLGSGSLRQAVTTVLERQPVPALRAKRGDPVLWVDPTATVAEASEHLGICTGADFAVLGPDGLKLARLDRAACAWNV